MDDASLAFLLGGCVGFLAGFAVCAIISRLYHRSYS